MANPPGRPRPVLLRTAVGCPSTGRWDAPAGQFGICYLAFEPRIAFAETLLRGGTAVVSEKRLAERSLARFEPGQPLRLATMHGPGLVRVGATAAVSSGPHEFSRAWSLALHQHPERPDGILYRTRHDDDGFGIALFDRAGAALRFVSTRPLLDSELYREVGGWPDLYGAGLD